MLPKVKSEHTEFYKPRQLMKKKKKCFAGIQCGPSSTKRDFVEKLNNEFGKKCALVNKDTLRQFCRHRLTLVQELIKSLQREISFERYVIV